LVTAPVPRGCQLAIPLTGRRWILVHGARVTAPSGLTCELSVGSRVTGGAVILDGTAVVVLAERPEGRELTVIGLSNGRLLHRQPVPGAEVRVATRSGLAAIRISRRQLAVIDLRSGRVLGH